MKKLISLGIALAVFASSFAQQALWEGSDIVSPQISDSNLVTFRLKAANANTVQLIGDFIPNTKIKTSKGEKEVAGIIDLQQTKEGLWEYTTPKPLNPELYSYSFVVDGLKMHDPSNIYVNRDVSSLANIFIVGGEHANLYRVNKVPHGTVAKRWYESPTL
ncbi:MAG: esterase, partial [Bacteroidaceae bacterium]